MNLLKAALWYAKRGWRVIPLHTPVNGGCSCGKPDCKSIGKHPRPGDWTNLATTHPDTLQGWWRQWPEANVGIATGAASGFIVLDVDPRHNGDETLREFEETHGSLPDTVEAITGSGGRHILFQHPGWPVRNKVSLAPGLDIRGDGGQIVAAPSVNQNGPYHWEASSHPKETPMAKAPSWLLEMLEKASYDPNPEGWADELLEGVEDGRRDDAAIRLAGRYVRLGLSDVEILRLLEDWNHRCKPPMGSLPGDARDVPGWIQEKIKSARQAESRKGKPQETTLVKTETLGEALQSVLPDLLAGRMPKILPFGLPELDAVLGGFRAGRVFSVAARTSMGKSAMAMRMALHAADLGKHVLYITQEMTGSDLALRALSAVTAIKIGTLDTGKLSPNQRRDLELHHGDLQELHSRITYHFQAGLTPEALLELVKQRKEDPGLDLLAVDHVGLLSTAATDTEYQSMTKIAQALKSIALSTEIPILALVQLNRMAEDNDKSKPTLRNLRGSGHLEEMSDVVMLLYRAKHYDDTLENDELEINIAKARQSETCRVGIPFEDVLKFRPKGKQPVKPRAMELFDGPGMGDHYARPAGH